MKPYRTILVGMGKMGRNHLRVLNEDPRFEPVAVVDPAVADRVVGPAPELVRAETLAELGDLEWDCAVVAAPTPLHAQIGRELLEFGRPFLMEKPLAATPAQCRELLELAEQRNVVVAVGHLERLNPAVRKLRELLDSGWLGGPIHFSFTRVGGYPEGRKGDDNVLVDLAVHDLDVLGFLAGPVHVNASVCHSAWQKGVFDTAEILLTADRGPSASIHVNWVTPTKIRTLRVTGTRGVCFVDYILQSCSLLGGHMLSRTMKSGFDFDSLLQQYRSTDRIEFGIVEQEPLKVQLSQFHRLLQGLPSDCCTLAEAARAVELADEALRVAQRSLHGPPPLPSTPGDEPSSMGQ